MLVKFTRAYRLTRGVDQVGSTFNTIAGLRSRRGVIIKGAERKVKLSTRARLSIVSAFQLWKRGIRFVVLEWPVRRHVRISIVFDSRKKKKGEEEVASRNRIVEFAMRKLLNYQMSRSNNREIFRNENWKGQRMIFDKMHFRKNLYCRLFFIHRMLVRLSFLFSCPLRCQRFLIKGWKKEVCS